MEREKNQPSSSPDIQTLVRLKRMLLYTQEDEHYLTMAGAILQPHSSSILNSWYGYLSANHYLSLYLRDKVEEKSGYLETLRPQFNQWMNAVCQGREGNSWKWLEDKIGKQLEQDTTTEKGSLPLVYLRYLSTFVYPIVTYSHPYLAGSGKNEEETARMQQAWFKAVSFSVLFWIYP
ncbi:hypothetical protein J2T02_000101 [Chitinophaga terrae (ex Kim and Jung 2007)]|jgi:hypothetical protein|uniref:protoglobin domain-containing protein n=1 Tax=Chitinophaga terrae (ex Kim and Jung 2007) TaxID=408074 RepID=UPI00278A8BF3|nr:protoglobin domain-containing protein [Chitinophaga terrae (ex Kim and Jung 2007)]MDQ0105018.1 hypothetical protein [Chitinophaga terrae (ex Kim and Jung 2007)]